MSRDDELTFTYFPDNYRWSHRLMLALGSAPWGGAEIDEVNRTGLRLRQRMGDERAWFEEWTRTAEREETAGRAPALIFFDGFDVTKEIQYFRGVPDLVERGIGCLLVDGPGNGEAIRFRNLPLHHETERYATPAYEFLAARPDVDPARI